MKGELVSMQLFDLGGTFDLRELQEAFADRKAGRVPAIGKGTPPYVEFPQPLVVPYGSLDVQTTTGPSRAEVALYYYPIGAVSVRLRVPVECESLSDLSTWQQMRVTLEGERLSLEGAARRIVASERTVWSRVVVDRYTEQILHESYTVFAFHEAERPAPAMVAEKGREVAGLLKGEPGARLYEKEVNEALKKWFSYYDDDVIVIDWDAAFIVDPSAEWEDLLFVLEIANLQLLEFRAYDDYLDDAIARSYDELEKLFRARSLLVGARRTVHELSMLRIEFAELADEADNITKFLGDWFLARVYQAAAEKFHLDSWRATVDEKLGTINGLYQLATAEGDTRRLIVLEVLIVLLFLLDLLLLFYLR